MCLKEDSYIHQCWIFITVKRVLLQKIFLQFKVTVLYGSPFKKKKKGNWHFFPHNSDFFTCNCEFTSPNSDFFARYKLAVLSFFLELHDTNSHLRVIKSILHAKNSQLRTKTELWQKKLYCKEINSRLWFYIYITIVILLCIFFHNSEKNSQLWEKTRNYLFYFYKYFYLWYFHIFLFLCILKCYLFLRRKAEFSSSITPVFRDHKSF